MTKLSKSYVEKLKCICGICAHNIFDSKCLYNKILDKKNPEMEMFNLIVKLTEKEVESNIKLNKSSLKTKTAKKTSKVNKTIKKVIKKTSKKKNEK